MRSDLVLFLSCSTLVVSLASAGYVKYTTEVRAPAAPTWRQCAPAQDGQELVSTSQWPDHTDCFYQQQKKGRVPARKEVTT